MKSKRNVSVLASFSMFTMTYFQRSKYQVHLCMVVCGKYCRSKWYSSTEMVEPRHRCREAHRERRASCLGQHPTGGRHLSITLKHMGRNSHGVDLSLTHWLKLPTYKCDYVIRTPIDLLATEAKFDKLKLCWSLGLDKNNQLVRARVKEEWHDMKDSSHQLREARCNCPQTRDMATMC